MNKEALIKEIKRKAKQDAKNRRDRRFLDTMGFLVAKGFLRTNLEIRLMPNKRLSVGDAIWAGRNVEPRILEVLPAAVLRLGKHFDFDPVKHPELARVLEQLRNQKETGPEFYALPYAKIKVWANFPLRDGRMKLLGEKKITKTFRLKPEAVFRLKSIALETGCTETDVLEKRILKD